MPQRFFCSLASHAAHEPLIGSAPRADVWLLLEYTGVWGSKALEESAIPIPVKQHLSAHLKLIPQARLQLIKRSARLSGRGPAFYVAVVRDVAPCLYAFRLDRYDDLLALDVPAIAAESPQYMAHRSSDRLILVCTNGRRDACCAKFGLSTYREMARLAGERVWQTTHLGGHRFAPTALTLPQGVCYGRIDPAAAASLVEADAGGQIDLEHVRGRVCYDPCVQAAEYYLRSETGFTGVDAYRLLGVDVGSSARWLVHFEDMHGGMVHNIMVAAEETAVHVRPSCDAVRTEPVIRYWRVDSPAVPGRA